MTTPQIKVNKEDKMTASGLKALVGRKMKKTIKFMGENVEIMKLSVADVKEIQELAQEINKAEDDEKKESLNFELIRKTVRSAVVGGEELEDADFENFPMDELSQLVDQVFKFSGMGAGDKGK